MTIELAIIIILAIDIFMAIIGRKLIFKVAKKLNEALEELEKNN